MQARAKAAEEKAAKAAALAESLKDKFGDAELIQSRVITGRKWTR